jgi:hypothetical protein
MKPAKLTGFFAQSSKLPGNKLPGILLGSLLQASLLAVLLAGCFNPITVIPPKSAENPLAEPFSVDILIGKDSRVETLAKAQAEARSVVVADGLRALCPGRNQSAEPVQLQGLPGCPPPALTRRKAAGWSHARIRREAGLTNPRRR